MKRLSILVSFLLIFTFAVSPMAEARGGSGGHSSSGSHSSFSSGGSHSYSSPGTSSRTGSFTSKGSSSSSPSTTHSYSSSNSGSPSTSSRSGSFSSTGKSSTSGSTGTFSSGKVTNGQTINPVTGGTFSGGARYYSSPPAGYHYNNDFWSHYTAFTAGTIFGHMFHPYGGYYPISGGTGYVYEPASTTWIIIDTILKYIVYITIIVLIIVFIRKWLTRMKHNR